jgi:hypothetical protein
MEILDRGRLCSRAACFLCGLKIVPGFQTRNRLSPHVFREYAVRRCAGCVSGKVNGTFTLTDVAAFDTPSYYARVEEGAWLPSSGGILAR